MLHYIVNVSYAHRNGKCLQTTATHKMSDMVHYTNKLLTQFHSAESTTSSTTATFSCCSQAYFSPVTIG